MNTTQSAAKRVVGKSHARAAKLNGIDLNLDDPIVNEMPHGVYPELDDEVGSMFAKAQAAYAAAMAKLNVPSFKRKLIAFTVGLFAYASTWYWAIQAAEALVVAAMTLTTSAFLIYLTAFIGCAIAFAVAMISGQAVYNMVMKFDGGVIMDRVNAVKGAFKLWRATRKLGVEQRATADMEAELARAAGL